MFNLRLRTRLLLSYLLVLLLGLGTLTIWVGSRLQRAIIEEREHELESEGFLVGLSLGEDLREAGEEEGDGEHTTALDRVRGFGNLVAQQEQRAVAIYDARGRPLLATYTAPPALPPEVASALGGTEMHAVRQHPDTGEAFLYVAVPVLHENHVVGAVQLGIPYATIRSEIYGTWSVLALAAGIVVLLGASAAIWLARSIAAPIQLLTETAEAIAGGDLMRRTHFRSGDEIGRLGQIFDRTADQLTRLLEQQRRFIADASHELRTPLTAIGLRAEALLGGARDDDLVAERYLHEIATETERMKQIIEDLLALSRFEVGLDRPQRKPVSATELVRRAVTSVAPLAERAESQISTEIVPPDLIMQVDAEQMHRALVNLLSNAIRHTPRAGCITLSVRATDGAEPGSLHVQVRDTGPGIPPEDLEHLFQRFYRPEKTSDRAGGGTGLGLAIVKAIVEAHDGRVWAESSPGQGATFHILLPPSAVARPEPE